MNIKKEADIGARKGRKGARTVKVEDDACYDIKRAIKLERGAEGSMNIEQEVVRVKIEPSSPPPYDLDLASQEADDVGATKRPSKARAVKVEASYDVALESGIKREVVRVKNEPLSPSSYDFGSQGVIKEKPPSSQGESVSNNIKTEADDQDSRASNAYTEAAISDVKMEHSIKQEVIEIEADPQYLPRKFKATGGSRLDRYKQSNLVACNLCEFKTVGGRGFARHMLLHKYKYVCRYCKIGMDQQNDYEEHMKIHIRKRPFACNLCDYRNAKQRKLNKHMNRHAELFDSNLEVDVTKHTPEAQFANDQSSNATSHMLKRCEGKHFACSMCGFKTQKKWTFRKHMKIHKLPFRYNLYKYRTAEESKVNVENHAIKLFTCNVCGFKTSGKVKFRKHMRSHTGGKSRKCNLCKVKCVEQKNLKRHMKNHRKQLKFKLCELATKIKRKLELHKRQHSLDKQPTCEFKQQSSLVLHIRFHAEEEPF